MFVANSLFIINYSFMKKLLLSFAVVALLVSTTAVAQNKQNKAEGKNKAKTEYTAQPAASGNNKTCCKEGKEGCCKNGKKDAKGCCSSNKNATQTKSCGKK